MSSIQANNLPDSQSDSPSGCSEREEPEPRSAERDPTARRRSVEVEILWDDCVSGRKRNLALSDKRIADAVVAAASERGFETGQIGVRVTDDPSIHEINRRHLSHDYPTDVISFPYGENTDQIEGELVVSLDTAEENSVDAGWETESELLLYIIHGVLHIGGMDDHEESDRAAMRNAERSVLTQLGMETGPAAEGKVSE